MKSDDKKDYREHSDTICILPFTSMSVHATGKITRCQMTEASAGDIADSATPIETWRGKKLSELRDKMLRGEKDEGCRNCYLREARGVKSKRTHWKKLGLAKDLWMKPEIFESEAPESIFHLDIAFSNFCNFNCRMCSSSYSSRWVKDEQKLKEMGMHGGSGGFIAKRATNYDRELNAISDEALKNIVDHCDQVRRIEILGGEPFKTKEFIKFLDLCLERGVGANTEIMITTNGSVFDADALKKLETFKYVNLNVSADATGPYFDYMRSNGALTWEEFDCNVDGFVAYCEDVNKRTGNTWKVNLNASFQTYNALNIEEYFHWVIRKFGWDHMCPVPNSKFRHSFEHRILFGPRHLNIEGAPVEVVKESLEQVRGLMKDHTFLSHITEVSYLNDILRVLEKSLITESEVKESAWFTFCFYTELLDKIRGQNLAEVDEKLADHLLETTNSEEYQTKKAFWQKGGAETLASNYKETRTL